MIENNTWPILMPWNQIGIIPSRIEMMFNAGLNIYVPDMIMPKFEFEPFTEDELREIYGHKLKPNISKFRSIIRKVKLTHDNRS